MDPPKNHEFSPLEPLWGCVGARFSTYVASRLYVQFPENTKAARFSSPEELQYFYNDSELLLEILRGKLVLL